MSGFSELETSVMEQSFNAKLPFGCLHLRPHAELNLCIDHQYQHHGHLGQQLVGLTVTVSKWEFNPEFDSVPIGNKRSAEDDLFALNRSTGASGMHPFLQTVTSSLRDEKSKRSANSASASAASGRHARRQVRRADVGARRRLARSQQVGFSPKRTEMLALADEASNREHLVHEALAQVKRFDPLNDLPSKLV